MTKPDKIVTMVPKDSPLPKLSKSLQRATGIPIGSLTHQEPLYRVLDRLRFGEICQLHLDGDPRFPTMGAVHDEALRLGFLELMHNEA